MFSGIEMTIEAGSGGPRLVKTATDLAGRTRLSEEADRLRRAAHPGVVELVEHEGDRLVLAWAGGQTFATITAPLSQAAGLLASVSATVGDLHELGIVHGALEPAHVVVGADGRPRICGLGAADPDGAAGPADDVAAIGVLIDTLVGPGVELEPIPDRRWGRRSWSGYHRRALQMLADQATQDDPERRPTARTLAAAIADAVPDSCLPPVQPGTVLPDPPERRSAPIEGDRTTTSEDVRTATSDQGGDGTAAETEADTETGHLDPVGHGSAPGPAVREVTSEVDLEPREQVFVPPTLLGMRIEEVDTSPEARDGAPERGPRTGVDRPTVARTRWRGPVRVAAAMAASVIAVLAIASVAHRPADSTVSDPASAVATGADPTSLIPAADASTPLSTLVGPVSADGRPCAPLIGPVADVDRDGCDEAVRVEGTTIVAGTLRFEVGEAGDHLAVGDWNCDGSATPAALRPSTGEVFVFTSWGAPERPTTIGATTVIPGARSIETSAKTACPPLIVHLAGDTTRTVTLPDGGS